MKHRSPKPGRIVAAPPARRSVGSTAETLASHAAMDAGRATSRREGTASLERWLSPKARSAVATGGLSGWEAERSRTDYQACAAASRDMEALFACAADVAGERAHTAVLG
jgi:hypothetical protein